LEEIPTSVLNMVRIPEPFQYGSNQRVESPALIESRAILRDVLRDKFEGIKVSIDS
jgi:hypothetical protein